MLPGGSRPPEENLPPGWRLRRSALGPFLWQSRGSYDILEFKRRADSSVAKLGTALCGLLGRWNHLLGSRFNVTGVTSKADP